MTILETFIQLRDDLKIWVTNNLNKKANISYVDEKFAEVPETVETAVANLENLAYINEEDIATSTNTINADTLGGYLPSMFAKQEAFDKVLDGIKPKAGFIYPLAGSVVPEGFLLCDGAECSRTEYKELFTAIGTIYGAGDGSTTFNVPNLQTRVPVGSGDGYELGDVGGEAEHTLTVDEMPSHNHMVKYNTNTNTTNITGATMGNGTVYSGAATYYTGGSQPHNNMQPYTVVNYIIATGKGNAVSVTDVVQGVQALPLGVEYGGTGATSAQTARENLGVAPAGYGLGGSAKLLYAHDDVNNIIATGWYSWGGTIPANAPAGLAGCVMEVIARGDTDVVQRVIHQNDAKMSILYRILNDTWGEWEWVNPPMSSGVEYRTTERWNGSPVYVRNFTYGYYSTSTTKIAHNIPSVAQPLCIELYNNGNEVLSTYSGVSTLHMDRTYIHISCVNNMGNIEFYLKYTKSS